MHRYIYFLIITTIFCGCRANLEVTKIAPGCAGDDVKGFRYYLGRPYVVVKKPILISEEISMVQVNEIGPGGERIQPFSAAVQRVPHAHAVHQVSVDDLQSIKSDFEKRLQGTNRFESISEVQLAGYAAPQEVEGTDTKPLETPDAEKVSARKPVSLGDIEIIYLPDFEEQYAVHNQNRLSKSAYALSFRDGWELVSVNGEFDSSTVAVEILNTIETAISAAQSVTTAKFEREKAEVEALQSASQMDAGPKSIRAPDKAETKFLQRTVKTFIKPGVYRINKPSEMGAGFPCGPDMLQNMGLTSTQTVSYSALPMTGVGLNRQVVPLGKPETGPFAN